MYPLVLLDDGPKVTKQHSFFRMAYFVYSPSLFIMVCRYLLTLRRY